MQTCILVKKKREKYFQIIAFYEILLRVHLFRVRVDSVEQTKVQ